MKKDFISSVEVRNNSLKLAKNIYEDNFIPDVIYVSLRGGAFLGNVVSEFFKMTHGRERPVLYAAVVARSYKDVRMKSRVCVDGWTYRPEYLRNGDKVLFVDDIFDSGQTINYLVNIILDKGLPRKDVRVAVHDYKVAPCDLPITPDYWCRKIDTDMAVSWIHYLSHELEGLTDEEIEREYLRNDPGLADVFSLIKYFSSKSAV